MRIAVYTIALNEEANVSRWANSITDADYVIVGDTGSTDGTIQALEKFSHIQVHKIHISPWRFDDARNAVLSLVPADADVCISLDMDEYLSPGWRAELEQNWLKNTTRLSYTYEFAKDVRYAADKIHARSGYRWRRTVHETVFNSGAELFAFAPGLIIHQIQDTTKDRKSYLPLLELSHKENPTDGQTLFWLAREYVNQQNNYSAFEHLKRYLAMPEDQTWSVERSEACRLLAQIDVNSNKTKWLKQALAECDSRREIWADLATAYYEQRDWTNCYWACANGLAIINSTGTYLDQSFAWGSLLWDLGSIAAYNLGFDKLAVEWVDRAVELDPTNERLLTNQKFIHQRIK